MFGFGANLSDILSTCHFRLIWYFLCAAGVNPESPLQFILQ